MSDIFLNRTFPKINEDIRKSIKYDDTALYSTTIEYDSEIIVKIISNSTRQNNSEITITDATAGIGGNTHYFSKFFKTVNAIEINKKRYEYLKHNMNLFLLTNIKFFNESCLKVCLRFRQDIIFIDPPWGGPEYKKEPFIKLYIDNNHLADVYTLLKPSCDYICLKLPLNFDFNDFICKIVFKRINIFKLKKMFIVLIRN